MIVSAIIMQARSAVGESFVFTSSYLPRSSLSEIEPRIVHMPDPSDQTAPCCSLQLIFDL